MDKNEKDQPYASQTYDQGVPAYSSDNSDVEMSGAERPGFWTRNGCTLESFKRRTLADKHNQLNKTLQGRHLHMIAIGGSIGAGLFVGSGSALRRGGAGALVLDFGIIGIMIFNVVYALGEMAVMYPVSGGFYTYSHRFIDPSWGFAMGWNYVLQWVAVLPLELTVAAFVIQYWDQSTSISVWISIFLVAIIVVSIFGVLGYAEEEFWASLLKLATVIIFIVTAIVLVCGGGREGSGYLGVEYECVDASGNPAICLIPDTPWNQYVGGKIFNSNPFTNGFKGVCSVFVTAAFAFSGTELVGLAAAESRNPRKALPGAIKQVFWRITLFYILALLMVGLLIYPEDPLLLGNGGLTDTRTSPFVIAARRAALNGLDDFINAVIMVAVLSIGLSGVYGGSRTLTALAEQGYAPKFFAYIDRAGRPLPSTAFVIAFGALAYIGESGKAGEVFDWLLALSGLAALFTWGSIVLAHIRFRQAWAYHGHTLDEIPFKAMFGVWGSAFSLAIIILVLIAQFYTALYPVGGPDLDAQSWFKAYLAAPLVILFWIGGFFWKRPGWLTVARMDVDSGRREIDWEAVKHEEAERANANAFMKFFYFLC